MRIIVAIFIAVLTSSCSSSVEDVLVGVFESETRQNFGSDKPGEYRIEVMTASKGKYVATFYHDDKQFAKLELVSCPVDALDYFRDRAPGRSEVLCSDDDIGVPHGVFAYSENGIYVPAVKQKYVSNPGLVKQEGLQPGDPSLFERRHHKAKYYAHVKGFFYGFRKVDQ